MTPPTYADILAAADRIASGVARTPMLRNAALDREAGATVLVKPECLQRTGSFKLRGATNAIRALDAAGRAGPIVAFSSGNHGQAVACAAAASGRQATIFMPANAPRIKMERTREWGAEIVTYDRATQDRDALAAEHAARTGAILVPPFDHPDVIAGQGTLARELIEDARAAGLPPLDALLVCTGGGGLVAGCALACAAESPGTRVYSVEPTGLDDTARSLAAGERLGVAPGAVSICDALLSPMPGVMTFEINRRLLGGGLVVDDAAVLGAMAFAFAHLKVVAEPGGAVALAAALTAASDAPWRGGVVGIVISGGNVDPVTFARAVS
jgi:threonine dehydratase